MKKVKNALLIIISAILISGCEKSEKESGSQPALTKPSIQGVFSYSDEKNGMGGSIQIEPIAKPTESSKYKAVFNGHIMRGDSANACELEGVLVGVTNNVFSLKSEENDDSQKFNLILVIEDNILTIFSTDKIEGCGVMAEMSVPGVYTREQKNK